MASNHPFTETCKPEYLDALNKLLAAKQATVFSATYCGYCNKAKGLLKRSKVDYDEIMIDELRPQDQEELSNCLY